MPRYHVKRFAVRDRAVWSVLDAETGRTVATYVTETAALALTHTLNVADLSASVIAFGAEP